MERHIHLFPIIRAIVIKRNSLPLFPFTPGLDIFRRYMKRSASRITFWLTCVVESIVVNHLRNPIDGIDSDTGGDSVTGCDNPVSTIFSFDAA